MKEKNDKMINFLINLLESNYAKEDKDRLAIIKLIDAYHTKNELLEQTFSNNEIKEAAARLGKKMMSAK